LTPYAVIFPFLGTELGGSHIATFRLGQSLKEIAGVACLVLCAEGSRIAEEATRYGLDVAFSGESSRHNEVLYDLAMVRRRKAVLARYAGRETIVHINDLEAMQSWAPCAKLMGQKVVYQHQSLNRASMKNRIKLMFADAALAVSDVCLRNLDYVDRRKTVKISCSCPVQGVDRAAARRRLLGDGAIPEDALLFGFVGNFWKRKRPHFFLDAARHIAAQQARARFFMFGAAREVSQTELEAYAEKLGLKGAVIFTGFRTPPEENIAALDVLMAPAIKEPFGLTPVEALLLGTPYVASADAGHLESFERWKGGMLLPKEASPEEFAAVTLKIARGEISPALAPERRAEIARELAPSTQAKAVLAVYRRLCPQSPVLAPQKA
jgi:glycosyltransferase involved in cell wall biosynthesis